MPILEQETCVYPNHLLVDPPYLMGRPSEDDASEDFDPNDRLWWAVYTKSRQEKSVGATFD